VRAVPVASGAAQAANVPSGFSTAFVTQTVSWMFVQIAPADQERWRIKDSMQFELDIG